MPEDELPRRPPFDRRPLGAPVSSFIQAPATVAYQPIRTVLRAIDSVHGDGGLTPVPVRRTRGEREVGAYVWSERDGRPLRLTVNVDAGHPHLTVAHEIGHILDHQVLGRRGRFASLDRRIPEVLNAIEASRAALALRVRRDQTAAIIQLPNGRKERWPVSQRVVEYLLDPKEAFARAYAQYITRRSGFPALAAELAAEHGSTVSARVYHMQWDDDDFDEIGDAIDRLFRTKRWLQ